MKRSKWNRGQVEVFFGIGIIVILIVLLVLGLGSFYTIGPSERGIRITMGKMDEVPLTPGMGGKLPLVTTIRTISIQQQTQGGDCDCFSSDLQQVKITINVMYRIPESQVVKIVRDYSGDPFTALIAPRVSEALKEVTANYTAANIVKNREAIKQAALEITKKKIGDILFIADLTLTNISLSKELEVAIEQKMVQQQAAEKASFEKQRAEIDAQTLVIKAKADAESIRVQGEALEKAPALVSLKWVEKWNGQMPIYSMGAGGSPGVLLDLRK